jgi:hypothetical protein
LEFNHLRALYVKYDKLYALLANRFFAVRHCLLVKGYKRTDYKQKAFFKRSFFERQISGNEIGNELIKGNGNFKY